MNKYLVLDCETGGFEGTSLLTFHFDVLDKDFNTLDSLSLFLRPKDHIYKVTAEALTVNHIDLIEHEKKAITYQEGGTLLFDFLQKNSLVPKYFVPATPGIAHIDFLSGKVDLVNFIPGIQPSIEKLSPLGHNVSGDIRRVKEELISPGSWDKFVSYRVEDTGTVGNYLKRKGKIPKEISGSLSSYATYFGIPITDAHTGKGDCAMTAAVYKEMLKL